jgi:hypothetical protein
VTHPESDMNKTNKNNIPQNKRNRDVWPYNGRGLFAHWPQSVD